MKKSIKIASIFILLIIFLTPYVFAADGVTTLEKVSEPVCTIKTDTYTFEKKLITFNKEDKSLNIQLKVSNSLNYESNTYMAGEFILAIDNSNSTLEEISSSEFTGTRRQAIISASKELATKLMDKYPTLKVGVVSFSSLDSSAGETEGTINDAKLISSPTTTKSDVLAAIDQIGTNQTGPRTNIEAGITVAQNAFTSDAKIKNLVIVSDGIPNNAVGGPTLTYSGEVATKTKAKLQEIENSGINIFTILAGVNGSTVETMTNKTYKELATEIFGTTDEPNYGKFFMIEDSNINNTLTNSIYTYITEKIRKPLTNIVIKDYFPQDIVNNFTFEYVQQPTKGTISEDIDENRCITWTIPELQPAETATVQYKLKLKENYNKEIIDKILPTNEKVDITLDGDTQTSSVTPQVVVKYIESQKPANTTNTDNTVANTVLPQTGEFSLAIISGVFVGILAVVFYIKKNKYTIEK